MSLWHGRLCAALLLLAAAYCCSLPGATSLGNPPLLKPRRIVTNSTTGRRTVYMDMRITVGRGAPDCYPRDVILVNGLFQPTVEVQTNDTLVVTVYNQLPSSFPQTASGISIHWHGLYMWGDAAWYDGTAYATQCPISRGANWTYRFLVDEAEGTYFWHDHATANRANGLQGAFIVRNPKIASPYETPTGEYTLFLSDWFHEEGNAMAMRLNRPAAAEFMTNNSGLYEGVPSAAAVLINGKGRYDDCSNSTDDAVRGANGVISPTCRPERNPLIGPDMDNVTGGCSHEVFQVGPGELYLFRIINSATQSYLSVCFEGHTMTLFNADSLPTSPDDLIEMCVDINSGQRYDVLVRADAGAPPGTSFWVTAHSQFRPMSPSAYAVMQYTAPMAHEGSTRRRQAAHRRLRQSYTPGGQYYSSPSTTRSPSSQSPSSGYVSPSPSPDGGYWDYNAPNALPYSPPPPPKVHTEPLPTPVWPSTPTPQPGVLPWTVVEMQQVYTHEGILGYLDNYDYQPYWQQYSHVGGEQYFSGVLYFPANRTITINMTAPLVTETGMIRWAMNNVVMPVNPPCKPIMKDIMQNRNWLLRNVLNSSDPAAIRAANLASLNLTRYNDITNNEKVPNVYVNGQPAPVIPLIGKHVAVVERNEIVDIVINNRPGNEGNGNSTAGPAAMVQHPMHMHGHKFWVLGIGMGVYNETLHRNTLNTYNPMLRDTLTLPVGAWAVIRFTANNPGIWPFHCHIVWHSFMGQQMYLLEDMNNWPRPPHNLPVCNSQCLYNFAGFDKSYINKTYGDASTNPHLLP